MKTKKKLIFARKCDWCNREITLNGRDGNPFVINANKRYFVWRQFQVEQPKEIA